jgi:carbamoyltransferase
MPNIVGISAYYHDSACCLLRKGRLCAAVQEERFSRRKHDSSLPKMGFRYCLTEEALTVSDIDCIAYYEDPHKKLNRQISMMLPNLSKAMALHFWRSEKRPIMEIREVLGYDGRIEIVDHHRSHAASSFFFSGFPEAAILTVDGVGEWATTTYGYGQGGDINIFEEVSFPNSVGLLYSTITDYLGFSVNDGEFKVMGLAPYGRPVYTDKFRELLHPQPEGQYSLAPDYFDFGRSDRMYTDQLIYLFGQPPRARRTSITTFHKDVARSLQEILEEILLEKVKYLFNKTASENLCLSGGVALNCVANSKILSKGPFKRLFVQPAAGDAGASIGAAAVAYSHITQKRPLQHKMDQVYLGPGYSSHEIASLIMRLGIEAQDFRDREGELLTATVNRLADNKVVGWFQGRMEFGPRALGARSILADPRDPDMRDRINSSVKKRESFRPFAPSILEEKAHLYFEMDHPSPFMLETFQVKSPVSLPAITHVDNSARVQTINEATNPRFARLLNAFERKTGCPILLNTSFNMRDEPIVCTPLDALLCFTRSEIDSLIIEDFIIDRPDLGSWGEFCKAYPLITDESASISDRVYTFI